MVSSSPQMTKNEEEQSICWRIVPPFSLHRLEQRADRNLMKFNKDICKVLHLVKRKPHRLGTDWLVSSSVEKTHGISVGSKQHVMHPWLEGAQTGYRRLFFSL